METIQYRPKGVCSSYMEIDVDNGVIQDCRVKGGCSGNLQGISALVRGMRVQDAISAWRASAADLRAPPVPTSWPRP